MRVPVAALQFGWSGTHPFLLPAHPPPEIEWNTNVKLLSKARQSSDPFPELRRCGTARPPLRLPQVGICSDPKLPVWIGSYDYDLPFLALNPECAALIKTLAPDDGAFFYRALPEEGPPRLEQPRTVVLAPRPSQTSATSCCHWRPRRSRALTLSSRRTSANTTSACM